MVWFSQSLIELEPTITNCLDSTLELKYETLGGTMSTCLRLEMYDEEGEFVHLHLGKEGATALRNALNQGIILLEKDKGALE
jgi:hypothetical protein